MNCSGRELRISAGDLARKVDEGKFALPVALCI